MNNNPINHTDPTGHFCVPCIVTIGIALAVYLATPENAYAPATDAPIQHASYSRDADYYDSAPGTGDLSDGYAAVTGQRLFTGEPQNRGEAALYAMAPVVTGGAAKLIFNGISPKGFKYASNVAEDIVADRQRTLWNKFATVADPDNNFQLYTREFADIEWCKGGFCGDHARYFAEKYGDDVRTIHIPKESIKIDGIDVSDPGFKHQFGIDEQGNVWNPSSNTWGQPLGEYLNRYGVDDIENYFVPN